MYRKELNMVVINTEKLHDLLREKYVDVEKFCNELKIDRAKFYFYCSDKRMPNNIYCRVCKKIGKEFKLYE